MQLKNIIAPEIPDLSLGDNGENALSLMEQFGVNHLPVVSLGKFNGLVSEDEVLSMENTNHTFMLHQHEFPMLCIMEDRHIFDALKVMSEQNISVLPVINKEMDYLGSISLQSLLQGLATLQSVSEPGAILVLEMSVHDYSLTQIAQIVEGNDARILSSSLSSAPDSTLIEVTLKINKEDLNPILQTFNRFEYKVVNTYMEPRFTEDLRDRYEEFMKFLNM